MFKLLRAKKKLKKGALIQVLELNSIQNCDEKFDFGYVNEGSISREVAFKKSYNTIENCNPVDVAKIKIIF